ncbi:MAG: DUF1302 domain-containing protein, partial [Oceanospirillaceae bacterium]|nr:DUF1302 domain-containing protein [Oceanospirillaceae bacterium]
MNKIKTLALAVAALSAAGSQAIEFNAGPVVGQINTSISYGVGFRTEDPDLKQVHPANANTALGTNLPISSTQGGSTYNYDDGTLNYKKNDMVTNVLKGNVDLELVWGDAGAFFRGSAFYDSVIMDEDPNFKPYNDQTKDAAGQGYDLLDAFVWYNAYLGDTPASLRLGRQVVSWGESTFILGGINSINPVNASAIRKPGVEVKEVLLPVNMAYGSFGLTDNVTLEAFYQLEWEKTRPDACGTFFSTSDFISDGCGPVFLGGTQDELVIAENSLTSSQLITTRITPDDEPSDDGQFGLALRWYSEALGDTEFGLYHMNIHSRLPLISGEASGGANGATPKYQVVYPEDIKLTGLSFSRGTESGWSIGGEVSLKQDVPFQWNSFELLQGGLRNPASLLTQQIIAPLVDSGMSEADAIASLSGQAFDGFDRFDVWQAQMTFIKFFDQVLGASRLSFVSEIGATYIPDLPSLSEARYGRSGAYGIGTIPDDTVSTGDLCTAPTLADGTTTNTTKNLNTDYCTNDGFVDELSYGIRARASLDYPNAFLGVNFKPQLSIGLDEGTAPEPG